MQTQDASDYCINNNDEVILQLKFDKFSRLRCGPTPTIERDCAVNAPLWLPPSACAVMPGALAHQSQAHVLGVSRSWSDGAQMDCRH